MLRRAALPAGCLVLLALFSLAPSQDIKIELVASTEALSPEDERKTFRLPPGFEAQLVAAEPDIAKPMNLAFDDRGRLWVTDTLEYPFPAAPDRKPRDSVKILDDFGPDGRARKITTFADGLNIPIGLLPLVGGREAIVYDIPNIRKFSDTDGDGKADKRELLYEKYGFRDTHGMTNAFTWGFDDWVYACHGFANDSTIAAKDGTKLTMNSGNVYRFKRDGSRVEQVTWGQVNPFGLSLDPLGNLYSADCHSLPIYQLLRGAYYPSFGKPHDGLGYGPEMMKHQHGSTGLAGVVYYAAADFPEEYQGTLFVGNVVTSRVNHDRIEWKGSTPRAVEQPDFLKSGDPWFRPVDLKLGPDGALYIADFYNCIIGHYEVPLTHPRRDRQRGRIWRIVYRGEDGSRKVESPHRDWNKASVKSLIADLNHPNLTVRMFAMHQLAHRGGDEVVRGVEGVLNSAPKPHQGAHALWVLERLGGVTDEVLGACAGAPTPEVRVQVMRVLSERKALNAQGAQRLHTGLKDADANVRRAATDALGRHGDIGHVEPLLELIRTTAREDTHLLHVARMALRNSLAKTPDWPTRFKKDARAPILADIALGMPTTAAAKYLTLYVEQKQKVGDVARLVEHVGRYGEDGTVEAITAHLRDEQPADLGRQVALFQALERGASKRGGKLHEVARNWGVSLTEKLLASRDAGHLQSGISLAGSLRLEKHRDQIATLLRAGKATEGQQLAALDALAGIAPESSIGLLDSVVGGADRPAKVRLQAAMILGRLNLPQARALLVKRLETGSAEVQLGLAVALTGSPVGAEELLKTIESGKASGRLVQDRIVAARLREAKLANLDKRLAKVTAGLPSADQRIDDLIRKRREGFFRSQERDLAQGLKVFEKNCATCHQLSGKGQRIGPQLDGIGARGLERLLEDTLDPGRNVDQAFRMTILTLKSGQTVRGLVLREEGGQYVLADEMGKERRINRDDVEERATSQLSPMPGNFVEQVSEADFYNLLAYLLTQRPMQR